MANANNSRPETGTIQFGDDRPGVFIRGDEAFGYRTALGHILRSLVVEDVWTASQVAVLEELGRVLASCDEASPRTALRPWAECLKLSDIESAVAFLAAHERDPEPTGSTASAQLVYLAKIMDVARALGWTKT